MSVQRYLVIGLILFSLALWLSNKQVYAQENTIELTVSPVFFELTTTKNSTIKDKFRVRNNATTPITLRVGVQKFSSDPSKENPVLQENTQEDEFLSWIKLEKSVITARPKEWTDVPFSIAIPKDAAFGYYFAFVVFPADLNPQTGLGTSLVSSTAIPTLLTVKAPGSIADAKLESFGPVSFITEYLPVDFAAKVVNNGNIHVKPRGNIFIRRGDKDIGILEINPSLGSILPQGKRTFTTGWNDGFIVKEPSLEDGVVKIDKNGTTVTHLKINWDKLTSFRIGPYTANLLFVYDNGTRDVTLESTTTFWVFPYKFIGLMLIGLLLTFFVFRTFLQAYIRSQIRKSR